MVRLIFIIILLNSCFNLIAQINLRGLDLNDNIDKWYDNSIGHKNLAVLEGQLYSIGNQSIVQHQFYKTLYRVNGSICYDGYQYQSIGMIYNIYNDQLILNNANANDVSEEFILPNQKKINSFNIHGKSFKYLSDSLAPNKMSGFYHFLYRGKINVLEKSTKEGRVKSDKLIYKEVVKLFINCNEQFFLYKNAKTFYKIFPTHKSEIKKFIKTEIGLLSKKDVNGIIKVTAYCERLTGL